MESVQKLCESRIDEKETRCLEKEKNRIRNSEIDELETELKRVRYRRQYFSALRSTVYL